MVVDFDRYVVLIEKLAKRTVMIRMDRSGLLGIGGRREGIPAATRRMMTARMLGGTCTTTMRVQAEEVGAMQRWPEV